ncbi:MAG: DUF72 domain-containing protein [Patescibacteria group bacterium]|nr:DUF72 domain-containing protein [Patescibacteria group bacterium]
MEKVYLGTSGWVYDDWKGRFYPKGLKSEERLRFYSTIFNTVEINSSFYRLLKLETFRKWAEDVPLEFRFSIKGSRYITHNLKMKPSKILEDAVARFLKTVEGLEEKGKLILWQLPPNSRVDLEKLDSFLELLARLQNRKLKNAFEFRHESWLNSAVYDTLKKYDSAMVIIDSPKWPKIQTLTASFAYLRFHGADSIYSSDYSEEDLRRWARKIKVWQKQGLEIYGYFNNDVKAFALKNAVSLKNILSRL